ncbi:MAG: hypothetical protein AAF761_01225 [Pseudomonadota bacterium]
MAGTQFLLRTMGADPVSLRLAETLAAVLHTPPIFVCDETRGPAETGPWAKLSITRETMRGLGFTGLPDNWGWLWGDMCYQIAAAHIPDADHFCLIESDVYLPPAGAGAFVDALSSSPVAAIAGRLRRYKDTQKFSRPLGRIGLDPHWGCIFPISRVSRNMIAAMGTLRQEATRAAPPHRLNDEGVLVGAVQRGGFSHAPLEDVAPDQVSPDTFETNPPHLFEALVARTHETRIFHPVVTRDTVIARVQSGEKNYNRHRLRKVMRMADADDRAAIDAALNTGVAGTP